MNIQGLDLDDFTAFEGGASTTAYSSPVLPTVFDLSTSTSSSTTNMGTVSPQHLLINEPFLSAPNSTALTALTSPSIYNESPDFGDSYDVSPSFGGGDFDSCAGDGWYPLFPPADNQSKVEPKAVQPDSSPASTSDDVDSAGSRAERHRRKSSGTAPSSGRHSSSAGVGSRHRSKPLPPIIVDDPTDVVAMKRARNTLAARKSRERKAQRLEELEERILKLTEERDHWKNLALACGAKE